MNTTYKPSEFSKMVGVSVKTLQRWDRDGVLKAYRSPTNRRYYTDEQIKNVMKNNDNEDKKEDKKEDLNNVIEKLLESTNLFEAQREYAKAFSILAEIYENKKKGF